MVFERACGSEAAFFSVCPSVCVSVCPSVCLFVSLSVLLSVCLSVCLSLCLSVCLSACLFALYSCTRPSNVMRLALGIHNFFAAVHDARYSRKH